MVDVNRGTNPRDAPRFHCIADGTASDSAA